MPRAIDGVLSSGVTGEGGPEQSQARALCMYAGERGPL